MVVQKEVGLVRSLASRDHGSRLGVLLLRDDLALLFGAL